jgi:hypothetical protein
MSKFFGPGSQPFTTQDALLAYCLWWAGVPFQDPLQPCFNLYDAEILKRLGFSGMTLEDAARTALSKRRRGHVEYIFKRPKELPALLAAFHDEERHIANDNGSGYERSRQIQSMNVPEEERRIREACLQSKMRLQFGRLWESQVPFLRIKDQGHPETIAPGTTQYPGCKVISLGASEKIKQKLGL